MPGHHPTLGEIQMTRKINPNWEDKDYGYVKPEKMWGMDFQDHYDYSHTPKGMRDIEDIAWRLEHLTQQWLEYARVKQKCLMGEDLDDFGCDEERGSEACRQCLEAASMDWLPLHF